MRDELKLAFSYGTFKVGFLLLLLTLVLSGLSMYGSSASFQESGHLTAGDVVDFNRPGFYAESVNLTLTSNYAVVNYTSLTTGTVEVRGEYSLELKTLPTLKVENGSVDYTVRAVGERHPFSVLAYVSFVTMLVGIVLAFIGYSRIMGDLGGKK
ncbi:hypothetical protein [Palaeococcus ferrophilus]|uniref:hypothetical protein n=1 Tax=Palaeococcus ferrophilus TaxID=83868 RepID=UPI00064E6A72|nr:hypothetical protein [Palaeococcus ferrophilus]